MMTEMAQCIESLNGRGDTKAILLESAQRAFSAGISLEDSKPDRVFQTLEAFNRVEAFRLNSLTTLSSTISKNFALKVNFKLMFNNDPPARPAATAIDPMTMMPFIYTADQAHFDKVDTQLDDNMLRFMSDRTRNRARDGRLQVSPVFKWFRDDFEKGDRGVYRLEDLFARYAAQLSDDPAQQAKVRAKTMPISWTDYDWSLNALGR